VYPEMSASTSVPRPAPECSSEITSPSSRESVNRTPALRRAHNRIEAESAVTARGTPSRMDEAVVTRAALMAESQGRTGVSKPHRP
jgi:hypothetical protein